MKAVALTYHDAVEGSNFAESGFVCDGAYVYKLDVSDLDLHFQAIAASRTDKPSHIHDVIENRNPTHVPFFLTFDDGGVSAVTHIAPLLDRLGWVGHFFVTAGLVDTDRFLSSRQVRDLHRKGHVIGSHSWSHPERMAKCSWDELEYEWRTSVTRLSDIIEQRVRVASVPGGYFSKYVAKAAAACGIRALFTSEPVKSTWHIDNCLILGRYALQRDDDPRLCRALASEQMSRAQINQYITWNIKKFIKAVAGDYYTTLRGQILTKRQHA